MTPALAQDRPEDARTWVERALEAHPSNVEALGSLADKLQQAKARILGVVFNEAQVEETAGSYSYYYANGHKR